MHVTPPLPTTHTEVKFVKTWRDYGSREVPVLKKRAPNVKHICCLLIGFQNSLFPGPGERTQQLRQQLPAVERT